MQLAVRHLRPSLPGARCRLTPRLVPAPAGRLKATSALPVAAAISLPAAFLMLGPSIAGPMATVLGACSLIGLIGWLQARMRAAVPSLSMQPSAFNISVMARCHSIAELYRPLPFTTGHFETIFASLTRCGRPNTHASPLTPHRIHLPPHAQPAIHHPCSGQCPP